VRAQIEAEKAAEKQAVEDEKEYAKTLGINVGR